MESKHISDSDQDKAEKPVKLVHYTTAEAACKILDSKQIWMRAYDLLNDRSELSYGYNYYKEEILPYQIEQEIGRLLLEQDKILLSSEGKKEYLLRFLIEKLKTKQKITSKERKTLLKLYDLSNKHENFFSFYESYIASFSETEKDNNCLQLSMWREYGGKTGVALIFTEEFFSNLQKLSDTILKEMMSQVSFGKVYYPKQDTKDVDIKKLAQDVQDNDTRAVIPFIKHPAFQEEKEYRLVVYYHFLPQIKNDDMKNKKNKLLEIVEKYGFGLDIGTEVIHGFPQEICKLTFSINDHLDCLVIGPTSDRSHAKAIKTGLTRILMTKKNRKRDPHIRYPSTSIPN